MSKIKSFLGFLLGISFLFPAVSARAAGGGDPLIWKGSSGGFQIEWTKKEISVYPVKSDVVTFSARSLAQGQWKETTREPDSKDYENLESYRVLSVVGSLVSLKQDNWCSCGGAHPSANVNFYAFDLAKPGEVTFNYGKKIGKSVSLNELFPEKDIFQALRADELVKQALETSVNPHPRTLAQLIKAISFGSSDPVIVGECDYAFHEDLLTHFAFHHLEGDKVAVRIGVRHGSELCRGKMVEIGILLPIPEALRAPLMEAESLKTGFLMKDLPRIAGNQETQLRFAGKNVAKED